MRKLSELRQKLVVGACALVLALGVFGVGFSMTSFVSHAETTVKVIANSGAKVRQSASTSSDSVGGAEKGKVLTVISQVQGSDGNIWYQVQLNASTTGYIRSDLVEVSEETPAGGGNETPAEVTEMNPVSASVTGEGGKIRSNASSSSQILKEVPAETVITVTGQAVDADGKTWYQVSFISEDAQVDGFIRSDYVTLSGDLTPKTEEPPQESDPAPETPVETKPYDVLLQNGEWLLVDYNTYEEPKGWSITEIFENLSKNQKAVEDSEKKVKSQKAVIIILVILLIAAVAGIAFLIFKIRDMMDSAYYSEVENETLRRKNAANSRGSQKVMQTVGTEKSSVRPTGAKPAGSGQGTRPAGTSQSQRTSAAGQGTRPAGTTTQGQRTSVSGQGTRPAGTSQDQRTSASGQGTRPAGTTQGQRTSATGQGTRLAGTTQGQRTSVSGQGTRPAGTSQGQRASGSAQGTRTVEASQSQRPSGTSQSSRTSQYGSSQRTQPKNFMEEDDDFEFEFLNYDGDNE